MADISGLRFMASPAALATGAGVSIEGGDLSGDPDRGEKCGEDEGCWMHCGKLWCDCE